MPDLIRFPFDKFHEKPESMPAHEQGSVTGKLVLPVTGWAAILRGLRGRCPRCGEARLFMRFLKPIPHCPQCGQDWTHQQADDFPAYVSIFVTGHLMAMLTILKGLPMTYNKDLQEDKEGAFDTIDTLKFSLSVYADMLKGMKINSQRMRQMLDDDFSNATDMADYLVRKGLPFREAHAVVGRAVRLAIETQRSLTELPLSELLALCPLFEEDILPALQIETCIEARNSEGGTASAQVRQALTNCHSIMQLQQTTIDMYTKSNI